MDGPANPAGLQPALGLPLAVSGVARTMRSQACFGRLADALTVEDWAGLDTAAVAEAPRTVGNTLVGKRPGGVPDHVRRYADNRLPRPRSPETGRHDGPGDGGA